MFDIIYSCLRWLDTSCIFSAILYMGDNFCDFLFAHQISFKKSLL